MADLDTNTTSLGLDLDAELAKAIALQGKSAELLHQSRSYIASLHIDKLVDITRRLNETMSWRDFDRILANLVSLTASMKQNLMGSWEYDKSAGIITYYDELGNKLRTVNVKETPEIVSHVVVQNSEESVDYGI